MKVFPTFSARSQAFAKLTDGDRLPVSTLLMWPGSKCTRAANCVSESPDFVR